jgi:hypothetical protein
VRWRQHWHSKLALFSLLLLLLLKYGSLVVVDVLNGLNFNQYV